MDYRDEEIAALADAIAITAFVTGNEKQVDAIVGILTEQARAPDRGPRQRELLRQIAMAMHDNRIKNADWKRALNAEPAKNVEPGP